MVAQPSEHRMTVQQWRELEQNSYDSKHEYIDGFVYAISGGSRAHSSIGSNMVRALQDALRARGKPCYTCNSDVAVRLSATRYTYPDASVTCDERDRPTVEETEIQSPRVIVEVLSDSTEAYDRGAKFSFYRACPSIQEYMLVTTKNQAVEVYRRTTDGWLLKSYGAGERVELVSLNISLAVDDVYRDSTVPMLNSENNIP